MFAFKTVKLVSKFSELLGLAVFKAIFEGIPVSLLKTGIAKISRSLLEIMFSYWFPLVNAVIE